MLPLVMAAQVLGSPGGAEDSQKATWPNASLALVKACVAMNVLHRAQVVGNKDSPDECHAAGSLAPVGRKPGYE